MSFVQRFDKVLGRTSYQWVYPKLLPGVRYNQAVYAEVLDGLITPKTRWLDGGCGHQVADMPVEQERSLVERAEFVVGCDLFAPSLEKHRTFRHRVMSSLDQLPFHDGSFNLVTLNMVVEHLAEPQKVFAEIARVLEPGGKVVLLTPNKKGYYVRVNNLAKTMLPEKLRLAMVSYIDGRESDDIFPTLYRANTQEDLRSLMQSVEMKPSQQLLLHGHAVFSFFAPACIVEILAGRALSALGGKQLLGWSLLEVYERQHPKPNLPVHPERASAAR